LRPALVGIVAVTLLGLADAGIAASERYPHIAVSDAVGSPPRERPQRLSVAADAAFAGLTWTGWGSAIATGHGTLDASLANGTGQFSHTPGQVVLSQPRDCAGVWLYTRLRYRIRGRLTTDSLSCRVVLAYSAENDSPLRAVFRPSTVVPEPNVPIIDLHWAGWGERVARGDGSVLGAPAQITLADVGWCDSLGSLAYRRMTVMDSVGGRRFTYSLEKRQACR
jgi:hypothetical protein